MLPQTADSSRNGRSVSQQPVQQNRSRFFWSVAAVCIVAVIGWTMRLVNSQTNVLGFSTTPETVIEQQAEPQTEQPRAASRESLQATNFLQAGHSTTSRSPANHSAIANTDNSATLKLSADFAQTWEQQSGSMALLKGRCRITHGDSSVTAQEMVIWLDTRNRNGQQYNRLSIYAEGQVRVQHPGTSSSHASTFFSLASKNKIQFHFRQQLRNHPATDDAIYQRALKQKKQNTERKNQNAIETHQSLPTSSSATNHQIDRTAHALTEPLTTSPLSRSPLTTEFTHRSENTGFSQNDQFPELISVQPQAQKAGTRRVRVFPRSAVAFSVRSFESKNSTPPEQVWIITGGVNLIIDGVKRFGTVDLSADRIVVWTRKKEDDAGFQNESQQSEETPFEAYLEGNVVIRQGGNIVRATRAVYDAREDRGLILDAELKTFVPKLNETVRIRAQQIRQFSKNSYHARNAWTSTSQFGKPGYRLRATDIFFQNRLIETVAPPISGPHIINQRGAFVEQVPYITTLNNTFLVEDIPLFYSPYMSAPARDPNIPLRRISVNRDSIFGTQLKTTWDMFSLLGMQRPKNWKRWELNADYLSSRGPALGTDARYKGNGLLGIPGHYGGDISLYGVLDGGRDNLGLHRQKLQPENKFRHRIQLKHRHQLPTGTTLLGEFGLLSDRNFLESYYEREFDTKKDVETLLYAKHIRDNSAWTLLTRPQLNSFENTTAWLPRGDFYMLGEPLFGGRLNFSMHSSLGYAQLRPGDKPTDPTDLATPLPYMANAEGIVSMSRYELTAPFSLGPIRIVPYLLGEAAFWGEDLTGKSADRLIGSAGIRSTLSFWKVFPQISSQLLNLNGLAHKSQIEAEYYFTDSTLDLARTPQYNEFDENSQERFRQRLVTNTFGGVLPPIFEPRMFAHRSGVGRSVTTPYHELIDDQQVLRLAWRHQLQTKVGPPEQMRIKDWMTLDLEASYFPNADRDNFGEEIGLLSASYRWNIGDRTSLLANAQYDLFDRAQQVWNLGVLTNRGSRGSAYLGIRQIKGANLDSQILTASASYSMSSKWLATLGTAYDLKEARNAGQSLTVTRIGTDFLLHFGANFDASKSNAGIAVSIEPRFGPFQNANNRLSSLFRGNQ